MSGLLLTNVFALSGGPRYHKNSFARGIPPRPLLAIRPAQRPINRCDQQPAGPFTSCLSFVFPVPFQRVRSAFCAPQRESADPPDQLPRADLTMRAQRLADPATLRPRPSPARGPAATRSNPPPHLPMTAPCHSDRLSPSSFTRTSSSSCRSGLPRSRQHLVWADVPPRPDLGRLAGREPSMITRATLTCSRKASAWRDFPGSPRSKPHPDCSICREPSPLAALRVAWRSNVVFVQSDFTVWQQDAAYNP